MNEQLKQIVRRDKETGKERNGKLWDLFLRGFPLRELAYQYVNADNLIREHCENEGEQVFEIWSGGCLC